MSVPRFWREIPQRYALTATRCTVCAATYYPPREVCPTCRRQSIGKLERVKLAGRGTIVEWTRVHKAAPGYELQVPYVVALVRTEEGPLVTGQIVDSEAAAVREGAHVQAVFRRLGADGDQGVIYYGTKWTVAQAPPAAAEPEAPRRRGLRRRS
ncbi:MAG: uncharacterized protein QOD77_2115 [Thermoplasmata archaeon]|jgi:uncharacterized OB-fold protein|nr:uncharacterized protein [Thermoplasmata archaeon]